MFWLIIAPVLLFIYFFYPEKIKKIIISLTSYNKQEAILTIVYDGAEIGNYTFTEFLKKKDSMTYDFILYKIPLLNHPIYDNYVLRYENIVDVLKVEYTSLKWLELTDVHMIVNETETYPIDFGRNQYYINGNILFDRQFLKWYLNVYHHIQLAEEDDYRVNFRDHEKKCITLPDYCYLYIKKNNYVIVNLIHL
jgi:hypothetical protein